MAGGGDPAKAIEKYHDRLLFLHLKDVVDSPMTAKSQYPFTWVELGRGKVDLPAVFAALAKVKYRGWGVVELDLYRTIPGHQAVCHDQPELPRKENRRQLLASLQIGPGDKL